MPTTAAAMSTSVRTSLALNVNGIDWPVMTLSIRNFSGHGCARSAKVISTVDAAAPPSAGQWRRTTFLITRLAPPAPGWVRSSSGWVCVPEGAFDIERSLLSLRASQSHQVTGRAMAKPGRSGYGPPHPAGADPHDEDPGQRDGSGMPPVGDFLP